MNVERIAFRIVGGVDDIVQFVPAADIKPLEQPFDVLAEFAQARLGNDSVDDENVTQ